ncbi:MAG: HypC/HybG/HupF family hydrogenase formation chaperone [Burkholderiales bacterium]|nr:HypC/HybG/HupF family hydrogenase formation chaperone [Burkholderiales bacterium]
MCIGVPLQLAAVDGLLGWSGGEAIDLSLVGTQPVGTWVLEFQGAARQVMSATEAAQTLAARAALAAVMAGGEVDMGQFFADLVGREPALPAHLRPA